MELHQKTPTDVFRQLERILCPGARFETGYGGEVQGLGYLGGAAADSQDGRLYPGE